MARYINVDYALASALADDVNAGIKDVVVTYDVGCQWGKNLFDRLSKPHMPPLKTDTLNSLRVAVPKFHIIGHGASCQTNFNLAYMDCVGMTHGESVETIWSHSSSLAIWSRENGPGARHLILDTHWTGWNWRKLVGLRKLPMLVIRNRATLTNTRLGEQLRKTLKRAIKGAKLQREEADSIARAWEPFVSDWSKMLSAYKADKSKPNPFQEPQNGRVSLVFVSIVN